MTQFRDRGVVLRTIRLGEADRIVTLMTEHHGKVRIIPVGPKAQAGCCRCWTRRELEWSGRRPFREPPTASSAAAASA